MALSQLWSSERVSSSASKSVQGPLKEMSAYPAAGPLIQSQSLRAFTTRNYGDFCFWHWNLGLGSQVWGWDPCYSGGNSTPEISLMIFNCHTWCGTSLFWASLPLLPVSRCLLYVLSCRTSTRLQGILNDDYSVI
uniref:Uncharacterized protein n=1 Tax=Rousettus aegyptiacus TaxID=9407 RepID=A0A7J8JI59_ROUAE|nr:hypothetical protein HJG63_010284 [Rousettus aegyptiacus]